MVAKPGGTRPPKFSPVGDTNAFVPKLLHNTKLIFSHQVQFFYFFYHLKSLITNLGWMRRINLQIIWLHSSNDLEILLVMLFSPSTFTWHKVNLFSSSLVFSFFYHLKSVIAKPREGGHVSPTFTPGGGGTKAFFPNFFMPQSQSSVIKFSSFIFSTTWSQW